MFFERYNNSGFGDTPLRYGGEDIGFFDAMSEAYSAQTRGLNIDAYTLLMTQELTPVIDAIQEREDVTFVNPGRFFGGSDSLGHNEKMRGHYLNKLLDHVNENEDIYPEFTDMTPESLDERIKTTALEAIQKGQEAAAREDMLGTLGGFVGSMGGIIADDAFFEQALMLGPVMVSGMSMGVGARGLGLAALREAVISGGIEASLQSGIMDWYQKLGLDYSYADFFKNVAAATALGAAFPPVLHAAGEGVGLIREGLRAYRGRGGKAKEADLVDDVLEDFDELRQATPPDVDAAEASALVAEASDSFERGSVPGHDAPLMETGEVPVTGRLPETDDLFGTALDDEIFLIEEIVDNQPISREISVGEARTIVAQDRIMLERMKECLL